MHLDYQNPVHKSHLGPYVYKLMGAGGRGRRGEQCYFSVHSFLSDATLARKMKKIKASAVMRPILLKTMISVIYFFLVICLVLVLVLWKLAI